MSYKQSAIDLIGDVVASMTFPVVITDVTGTNPYVLTVDDIQHAEPGRTFTYNAVVYTITAIDADESKITVTGASAPDEGTFNLYNPYYYHGTPIATETELKKESNAAEKTPMVWFLETFKERVYESFLSNFEREITFRLFFLTQADHDKWLTGTAYTNAIMPMRRLAENFILTLKGYKDANCRIVFHTEDLQYDLTNYAKFGVFISMRGMEKQLFADELSGVELSLTLKVNRLQAC